MESAENKAAPTFSMKIAGHYQPMLWQASCNGSRVPNGNAPAYSQANKVGSTSDQRSGISSCETGSDSSFGSDSIALIVDSISDDEVIPEINVST